MKYLMWLLKAAIFFTLFAFALNNQQIVAVNFFFGTVWSAPLVMVVLTIFTTGLALGVLLMMPRWWHKRRAAADANKRSKFDVGNNSWGNTAQPGPAPNVPVATNPVVNPAVAATHGL